MGTRLIRRHLVQDHRLSETLVRTAAARLAEVMAGGENGYSESYDPDGWFRLVTEDRHAQARRTGHGYSACEDLHGAVYLRLCGMPPALPELRDVLRWCNREEAGNRWQIGRNLIRLKQYLPTAWRAYKRSTTWEIRLGDAVQIQGRHEHTFVVTALQYRDGLPILCDHADYGQHHQPEGAPRADHSCRVYCGVPVTDGPKGCYIGGKPIIGRASVWDVVRHVWEHPDAGWALPAWVPEGFSLGMEADNPYLPEGP